MYQTMSLPLYSGSFEEYHGWGDLRAELAALGCDGMEGIWSGEEFPEDLLKQTWSSAITSPSIRTGWTSTGMTGGR
ncbi:hypothetical protein M5E87_25515 [Flavonifractor plautii]|nr:hypothetical protein M5E87_25515 [Flavonifractor plautii]